MRVNTVQLLEQIVETFLQLLHRVPAFGVGHGLDHILALALVVVLGIAGLGVLQQTLFINVRLRLEHARKTVYSQPVTRSCPDLFQRHPCTSYNR